MTSGEEHDGKTEYLKIFALHFVMTVEYIFNSYKQILDGETLETDPHEIFSALAGFTCDALKMEKASAFSLLKKCSTSFNKWKFKKKACKIPKIIQDCKEREDNFRRTLIEGAFDVFCKFEYQFSLISHKAAVQKFAVDVAHRFLSYLIENKKDIDDVSTEIVTKGMLLGESPRNLNRRLKRGRTLFINDVNVSTDDFFRKTSLRNVENGAITYYEKKDCIPELKHRLTFYWESDMRKYRIVSPRYTYKYEYVQKSREIQIEMLLNYVKSENMKKNASGDEGSINDTCLQDTMRKNDNRHIIIAK